MLFALIYGQFRGDFTPKTKLTMLAARAGLVMDQGSKVTYNGVSIGRVAGISEVEHRGKPAARFTLDVDPQYVDLIPLNVIAKIQATTVFGNKYVSLTSPKDPAPQRITSSSVIDATSVTTEFNTVFETLVELADNVDPVKVNLTLSAAAQALTGLGDKFGQSIVNGNKILDHVNPRMPTIRHDIHQLAALGDVYAKAAPDLFDAIENAVTTARTLNHHQAELDAALLAAVGFANTGNDIFTRAKPYLERLTADLKPTAHLLDTYSPQAFCTIRNFADVAPKVAAAGERQPLCGPTRGGDHRLGEPVCVSGQPAAGQRSGRTGRQAGLLAADHPRSVAGAVPGDGLRQQHCAVQPLRAGPAAGQRIRLGPPVRGVHDQPMRINGTVARLAAVVSVQLFFTAVIVVVFGQIRFDRTNNYSAEFSNASGLRAGQFVRASGCGSRQGQKGRPGRRATSGSGSNSRSIARCSSTSRRPRKSVTRI